MGALTEIRSSGVWEVVVAGGGPAGCAAATAAAQEGKRVLLIESTGALGGMGTSGLVPAWCPFSDGKQILYRGLAEHIFSESKKGCRHVHPDALNWVPIDAEHLKRVYDDLLEEAEAQVLFFTTVAGVEADDDRISRVLIANKAGLSAVEAQIFIDCTGDGDLCAWAGADWEKGDATGAVQPATHCFTLGGVNLYHYQNGQHPSRAIMQRHFAPDIPARLSDLHLCNSIVGSNTIGFNAGHLWNVDGTDPLALSAAMREGRKIAKEFHTAIAETYPGAFGGAHLVATAPLLGIRETRRIVGDYTLTLTDYLKRKSFPDEIARNCYAVDVHAAQDEIAGALEGKVDAMTRFENYKAGESHGIPYRCLIPARLENVLVAGRCISTDRPVHASTRVMPVALVTGEAAGVAAALACSEQGRTREVRPEALRTRLRERGAYLP